MCFKVTLSFFFLRLSWPLVSSRTRLGRPLLSSWSRWYRTPLLPYPKRNFLLSLKTSSPNGNNEFVLRWYGTSWVINIDKSTLYHIQNIIINLKFSNRIVFDYKIHLNYYDYWVFLVKEKNKVTVQFISFFVKRKYITIFWCPITPSYNACHREYLDVVLNNQRFLVLLWRTTCIWITWYMYLLKINFIQMKNYNIILSVN